MLFLAGLAYYQGNPEPATGDNASLVGTAVIDAPEVEENTEVLTAEVVVAVNCEPAIDAEDPGSEDCEKRSHQ